MNEKKATKQVMRLVDPRTGEMECRVCGSHHWANIRPQSNGQFYRGSWQCVNGCKLEDLKTAEITPEQAMKIAGHSPAPQKRYRKLNEFN